MIDTVLENLTQKNLETASPDWHQDLLLERDKALKNEQDNFVDWADAKLQLLKKLAIAEKK